MKKNPDTSTDLYNDIHVILYRSVDTSKNQVAQMIVSSEYYCPDSTRTSQRRLFDVCLSVIRL